MSGLEIFGAVTAAFGLISKVVKVFGTPRNAPRQVERLKRILEDLKDERLLAAAREDQKIRIHRLINTCTDLLERNADEDHSNRPWSFFWPATAEEQLQYHNDRIMEELGSILMRMQVDRFTRQARPLLCINWGS